eukprot:156033_1
MSLSSQIQQCISLLENNITTFSHLVALKFEVICNKDRLSFESIEIIEWYAIILDIEHNVIRKSTSEYFHIYLKPKTTVDNGVSVEKALQLWNKWCYNNDLLSDTETPKTCIVTYGDWYLQTVWTKQCNALNFSFDSTANLFHSWINIETIFEIIMNTKPYNMINMLQTLNIKQSIDHVKNITNIIIHLYHRNKLLFDRPTSYFISKTMHQNRSIYDDICYKFRMDQMKLCKSTNKTMSENKNKVEQKDEVKEITVIPKTDKESLLPRIKTLPIKKCILPWINNANSVEMSVLKFFHTDPMAQFAAGYGCDIIIDTSTSIYIKNQNTATTLLCNVDNNNKNVKFKSVEHIFQCAKAANRCDDLFIRELSAHDATRCGRGKFYIRSNKLKLLYESFGGKCVQVGTGKRIRYLISKNGQLKVRENWDDIKIQIMYYALKNKFLQNKYLIQEYILDNLPTYFINHTEDPKHNVWGDAARLKNGKNYLGKLLTIIAWMMKFHLNDFENNDKMCVDLLDESFLQWMNLPNNQIFVTGQ